MAWGAPEWVTVIGFSLAGIWLLSKALGLVWHVVRTPFVALFYHFVDERVFAGVNSLEDGGVMSEAENRTPDPRFRAGFDVPVLARPFQAEPEPVRQKSWSEIGATLQNDEALIDLLSTIKVDGEYRFSANKIRDIVGGADAAVKARVASHRPKPAQPRPPARIVRPENGW